MGNIGDVLYGGVKRGDVLYGGMCYTGGGIIRGVCNRGIYYINCSQLLNH